MFNTPLHLKPLFLRGLPLAAAFLMLIPQAQAAKYLMGDNDTLVKGCTGTVEVKIDTEGSSVMAGDSTLNIDSNEVAVSQVSIGSALPLQVFNQVTDTQIKLSAARLPASGVFSGVGTLGYITFMPGLTATSGSFTFSPDLMSDNVLVDENIDNVLSGVVNKTYTFKDRYDQAVDGVGFCTPDSTKPVVQFINPVPYASSVPATTPLVFVLTDNRSGVNMNSLTFTVDGAPYNSTSPEVAVTNDGKLYRVEMTPATPFQAGASVSLKVYVCDLSSSNNCVDSENIFHIYSATVQASVCGDGNVQAGEQCDHGTQNGTSGDSCSSLCLNVTQAAPRTESSSCFDGLHNQGETGLDCGGPCGPCPTCVDGTKNQGEEGVDCGGPCPACGTRAQIVCETPVAPTVTAEPSAAAPLEFVTICHTPSDDPLHPITMSVPKTLAADYIKKGDTEGACSLEQMCNILIPVAPEIQKKAVEEAATVNATEESSKQQAAVIEAPKTQEKSVDQITICKAIPDYLKANFDNVSADTDGDGLSDRTECYARTSPINADTDGDGCTDGDELNRFNSNPVDPTDCKLATEAEQGFNQVLITDPKPSWTLGNVSPRFSGMIPIKSTAVTLTAFHADQKAVKALSSAVNAVLQANNRDSAAKAVVSLKTATEEARKFVDLNGLDFNYADLQTVVSKIETQVLTLEKEVGKTGSFVSKDYFEILKKLGFGDLGLELGGLTREPIVLGSSNDFSQTLLGGQSVGSFEFSSDSPLEDQKLYDVVATATRGDKIVSSTPIQFGINTGFTVSKPIPRTLGGILIPSGKLSFGGILIDDAFAQSENGQPQIEILQSKPVITGDTEFGSQVYAIWNSVVLSSSVISDSEQGAFEIQAPKDLEVNTPHRVTLYAVKMDKGKTLRSESVDIYFRIKSEKGSVLPLVGAGVGLLLLASGAYFLIRRSQNARSVVRLLKSARR